MKKNVFTILFALFAIATTAQAQVVLNETNFPDRNFRKTLAEKLGINEGDEISAEQIANMKELDARSIQNLKGIEFFTELTKLECGVVGEGKLTLDVSKNTKLEYLSCRGVVLESLDVSKNTALKYLKISFSVLSSLDVSKNTALEELQIIQESGYFARLTDLNVSGAIALKKLECTDTALTSLDLSQNTALTDLLCRFNDQLTSLDVSKNAALERLECYNNQLTSLDLTNNTALTELACYKNQLTSLDVSKNTALTELNCSSNKLTSLDVSKNTALTYLDCSFNQLTSLDVSNNTALTGLGCSFNQLTSLDVSNNTALTGLGCSSNKLTSLDVSNNTALTGLNCDNNQLTSLNVSQNTALTGLNCSFNQLTSLDVSKNTALTELNCYNNQLTSLEVSGCTALQLLWCYNNQLTSLDVSGCTSLGSLQCDRNQLTSLNVSGCTALQSLYCYNNQLTLLNVSGCTSLWNLQCYDNQLPALDISECPSLRWLICYNNQLTSLDVSKNTALTDLRCYSNQIKGEAMDALVGSLPTVSKGSFYVIDTKDKNEGNICTKAQVTVAKGKGWTVYDHNGGNRPYPEYEGSDPVATKLLLNAENFPDANFRAALAKILGISEGDEITEAKIAATTLLKVNRKSIADLTGIEHFTALTDLYCYNNQLTSLDMSKNTALTSLHCHENQLTALDVSKNTALEYLSCNNNQLTSLDVSQNTALKYLYCGDNQLTSLDVSKNTALEYLSCNNNQLTSLDVSKNIALQRLYCYGNQIKGEAMDALVASLPTVESGSFYVINTKDENEGNICTKAQVAVAKEKGWTVFDYNYDGINWIGPVEYEGSDPVAEDINPVDEDDNIDFGSDMDENDDLNGNVIGDIFYNIGNGNGEYNAEEGCIVLKKTTNDETVDGLSGKDIFGEDFKGQFTGIVFKVPSGKGTVKVTAETTGNMLLKVKIGDNEPVEMELNGKLKISFPYNVSETTLVYIYAGAANEAKGFGTTNATEDAALKIYGIEFERGETTAIDASLNENGKMTNDSWYTIDGVKLNGEPKKKGIYIYKGKKVKK